ncbi:hypothetical protein G3M48_009751 [Beauveria asiatica]|uniref:Meiotic recombination protein DMC1 n=1 Tax=Beauveria asiatica TaxID=1069075 RepID=A0AAW0S2C5_9HYPO
MEGESAPQPGGFIPPTSLLTPTPSTASSRPVVALPHPRQKPLNPSGSKGDQVRRSIEDELLNISRRYVKKFSGPDPDNPVVGYTNFTEIAKNLEDVVDTLWRTGTHHCFASLLCGHDIATQQVLPGFENGLRGGMTTTDMVRCRSLVEQTRVLIVEMISNETSEGSDEDSGDGDDEDDDQEIDIDDEDDGDNELASVRLEAARVYENTIIQLGNRLGDGGLAPT